MKYPHGRKLSKNAAEAVRFVAKVGSLEREIWYKLFGQGTLRWKQMQLQHLINRKIFKYNTSKHGHDAVVIDRFGVELIKSMGWQHVNTIYPHEIEHDVTIGAGAWEIEKAGFCQKWMTERELKSQKLDNFKLDLKNDGIKYPDIVCRIHGKTTSPIVAFEYEKTSKTNWRYNKTIKAYSEGFNFSYIFFVVANASIEQTIKKAMQYIQDGQLNSKIGFISVEDWKRNPLNAKIRGLKIAENLTELASKI
tara:strand:- start:92400 stop:93149 length:750 start_codon:yes stop_codon:yes gene_type:complete